MSPANCSLRESQTPSDGGQGGIGARLRAAVAAPPCPKGMNIISRRWNLRTKRRALSFWATPQGSNSDPCGVGLHLAVDVYRRFHLRLMILGPFGTRDGA